MVVAAFRRHARSLFLGHAITTVVAIATMLLFAVPSIDFRSLNARHPSNSLTVLATSRATPARATAQAAEIPDAVEREP
ncbi:hypothetical protein J2S48_003912 [Promicromonospora iranensis]|uniref:MMPL family protein n=1 Tax=Promicromonospora iranensis TaxID=1105144 RepID=A0ABU2CSS6_9MICO|nr:hypothetical protein [Promicromonospora iranensis]